MNPGPDRPWVIRPVSRPRLYEQLVERLCEYIDHHDLQPGDKLPPERRLAAMLKVSRVSVAQALVALEVQGMVDVRHGEGAVVLHRQTEAQVISGLRDRRRRLSEVLEVREALEVKAAELAAGRRTERDLERIDDALQQMADQIAAGERGESGDARFHAAVTAAAHSDLIATVMAELAPRIDESRTESLAQPGRPHQSLGGHQRVAAAVRDGDGLGAAHAMREHIRLVSNVALLREGQ